MHARSIALFAVAAVLAAPAASAAPPGPPPKHAASYPPPAWLETASRSLWLAYSSFCWTTTCADFIPPLLRKDIPAVTVRKGAIVRLHLAFQPTKVSVGLVSSKGIGPVVKLAPTRTTRWRIGRAGLWLVSVDVNGRGDASYVVRIRLRI